MDKGHRAAALFGVFSLLAAGACGSDESSEVVKGQAIDPAGVGMIRGEVTRTVALSEEGDGVGALHIALAEECLAKAGTAPKLLAKIDVDEADLSDDDAKIAFEVSGLADGVYQASTWFDDVINEDQDEDLPGKGDLAMFKAATPICVEVKVADGKLVEDVTLALNYVMPFNLTGTMADDRGGVLGEGAGSGVDPSDIDTDDPNTYAVTFALTRSVELGEGGDGVGDALFTLSETCFEATGNPPPPLHTLEQLNVDLKDPKARVALTFEGVKNGIYQLNGYLDDANPRSAARPLPNNGDLVRFGGFGPGCVEVVVNGKDVETEFDLNFVMTWDLND
jgi:hypothetical protein